MSEPAYERHRTELLRISMDKRAPPADRECALASNAGMMILECRAGLHRRATDGLTARRWTWSTTRTLALFEEPRRPGEDSIARSTLAVLRHDLALAESRDAATLAAMLSGAAQARSVGAGDIAEDVEGWAERIFRFRRIEPPTEPLEIARAARAATRRYDLLPRELRGADR